MEDQLRTIKKVIDEHKSVRENIKLVGDAITDAEALRTLERVNASGVASEVAALAGLQQRLRVAWCTLDEGLKTHFALEEKVLPDILGELFTQALVIEHRELKKSIDEAKAIIDSTVVERALGEDELLSRKARLEQVTGKIYHIVESHANREEVLLDYARKALEVREKK